LEQVANLLLLREINRKVRKEFIVTLCELCAYSANSAVKNFFVVVFYEIIKTLIFGNIYIVHLRFI